MKRFSIITEADARVLEPGSAIALAPRGVITPLARDTLRARRITVLQDGDADEASRDAGITVGAIKILAVGSDHTGVTLKRTLVPYLRSRGLTVHDMGTHTTDAVDYPDIAATVALAVARREVDAGIVIDAAGIGSAMAANKIRGVRAAMCPDERIARYSREHNGSNLITLGATLLTSEQAERVVDAWLSSSMSESRYIRRLIKIHRLEEQGWTRPI